MTIEDINARLKEIENLAYDAEKAHSKEDALWRNVLESIAASGVYHYADMAREALKSRNIIFERWCA